MIASSMPCFFEPDQQEMSQPVRRDRVGNASRCRVALEEPEQRLTTTLPLLGSGAPRGPLCQMARGGLVQPGLNWPELTGQAWSGFPW
jgi:hypothetical protein